MAAGKRKRRKTSQTLDDGVLNAASVIDGIRWPGVGNGATNTILAIYYQLQQSEWLGGEELALNQRRQLHYLLQHAAQTAHYAAVLREIGWNQNVPLSAETWRRLPLTDRRTVQSKRADLLNNGLPKMHGGLKVARTSGSTGMPVEVEWPQILMFFIHALAIREQMWQQRDLAGRYASIRVFKGVAEAQAPPGARTRGWKALSGVLEPQGETFVLDISVSIDQQLAWLESVNPHYFATYPSNLKALLGRVAVRSRRLRVPALKQVRTMSETVDAELRATVAELLGVPLIDDYSAQEVGTIAFQCPDYPVYHVQSESVLVEVVDEDDTLCEPGEVGRVVVTHLHNLRMPLLRYDIGDYAEVGEPCPCGRGLPVLRQILGRSRNMLHYPDGRRRWPLPGDGRYREIAPIEQYQFIQRDLGRLDVNLVAGRPLSADEQSRFKAWVRKRLDYPFELTLHFFDEIPRHASGKFEDFRCELEP